MRDNTNLGNAPNPVTRVAKNINEGLWERSLMSARMLRADNSRWVERYLGRYALLEAPGADAIEEPALFAAALALARVRERAREAGPRPLWGDSARFRFRAGATEGVAWEAANPEALCAESGNGFGVTGNRTLNRTLLGSTAAGKARAAAT